MARRADIGAAIIGSGLIGTVHIEPLRRIGVRVVGLLESSPELGVAGRHVTDVVRTAAAAASTSRSSLEVPSP